ncbi:MAG TPA: DOMON-like domain-containing protein [Azospira sp.]|nr:DOMON-like domain-containing protein [Azospira sp.]
MPMNPAPAETLLLPHPDYAAAPVAAIAVAAARRADGGLTLNYRLQGNLAGLRLPAAPLDPDRLWAHTCFEVFLARGEAAAYREYNFSPTGQWAAYAFAAYRQREAGAAALPAPLLAWQGRPDGLALEVTLPAAALPAGDGPLALALTAVLELADGAPGQLSYWALAHPPGQADFHHRDGFALSLP